MKTVKVSNMDITPPKTTSGDYNSEMSQQIGLMHSKALFVHRRNSSALFVHQHRELVTLRQHYILCPWAFGTLWIDPKTSKIGRNGALDLVILH